MEAKEDALEISGVSSAGGGGGGLPCRQVPKMGMEMLPVIAVGPSDPSAILQPAPLPLSRAHLLRSLCC